MIVETLLRVATERPVIAAWITSWLSLAASVSTHSMQEYAAVFAGFMAGLSALAATVYTVVKTVKEVRKK